MNLTSSNAAWLPIHTLSKLCADAGSAITSSKPTCQVNRAMQKQGKTQLALTRTMGGGMRARTEAAISRYSGSKGTKRGHVKWCTQMIRVARRQRVVFTFEEQSRKVTFNCALTSCGSRSGADEYSLAFLDRMGSIDLLNSSSSIIMLDSSFSFSRPMLLSRQRAGDGALCALRRTQRHPSPYGKQRSVGPRRRNRLRATSPDHFPDD